MIINDIEQKLIFISQQLFDIKIILGQISVTLVGLAIFFIEPNQRLVAKVIILGGAVLGAIVLAHRLTDD